jgi:hypothetical protein
MKNMKFFPVYQVLFKVTTTGYACLKNIFFFLGKDKNSPQEKGLPSCWSSSLGSTLTTACTQHKRVLHFLRLSINPSKGGGGAVCPT